MWAGELAWACFFSGVGWSQQWSSRPRISRGHLELLTAATLRSENTEVRHVILLVIPRCSQKKGLAAESTSCDCEILLEPPLTEMSHSAKTGSTCPPQASHRQFQP